MENKEVGKPASDVNPQFCVKCRFLEICQYRENEGINLSSFIALPDGGCEKFKERGGEMDKVAEALKICEEGIKNSFPHFSWYYPEGHGPIGCVKIEVAPLAYLERIRDILQKTDSCSVEF